MATASTTSQTTSVRQYLQDLMARHAAELQRDIDATIARLKRPSQITLDSSPYSRVYQAAAASQAGIITLQKLIADLVRQEQQAAQQAYRHQTQEDEEGITLLTAQYENALRQDEDKTGADETGPVQLWQHNNFSTLCTDLLASSESVLEQVSALEQSRLDLQAAIKAVHTFLLVNSAPCANPGLGQGLFAAAISTITGFLQRLLPNNLFSQSANEDGVVSSITIPMADDSLAPMPRIMPELSAQLNAVQQARLTALLQAVENCQQRYTACVLEYNAHATRHNDLYDQHLDYQPMPFAPSAPIATI